MVYNIHRAKLILSADPDIIIFVRTRQKNLILVIRHMRSKKHGPHMDFVPLIEDIS